MSLMRVKFARERAARWLLQREFLHAIQEAVLAAGLPVATTGGSTPRPACAPGLPLAPGHLSRCEYVDFVICSPITATEFGRRLSSALPEGIRALWQGRMKARTPNPKAAIRGFRYVCRGTFDPGRAEAFRVAPSWPLPQFRKGRERILELKRSITRLRVEPNRVIFDIEVRGEGMPKPEEVIASVFGMTLQEAMALPTERTAARFERIRPSHQLVREY